MFSSSSKQLWSGIVSISVNKTPPPQEKTFLTSCQTSVSVYAHATKKNAFFLVIKGKRGAAKGGDGEAIVAICRHRSSSNAFYPYCLPQPVLLFCTLFTRLTASAITWSFFLLPTFFAYFSIRHVKRDTCTWVRFLFDFALSTFGQCKCYRKCIGCNHQCSWRVQVTGMGDMQDTVTGKAEKVSTNGVWVSKKIDKK